MYGSHASEVTPKMRQPDKLTNESIKAAISTGVEHGKKCKKLADGGGLFLLLQTDARPLGASSTALPASNRA